MANVVLNVRPGFVTDRERYLREAPPFSVAIDGYVRGGPWFDENGPRQNFNHHEDVPRLETRATCAQALLNVRQGFFDTFRDAHGPRVAVDANDCDQDVALTWFLFSTSSLARTVSQPALNRLVGCVDLMDATGGAYPFPEDAPILEEMAWIFDPYVRFRLSGEIDKMDAASYRGIIEAVCRRIGDYVNGRGRSKPLELGYDTIGGGSGWIMVRETGGQARTKMFADGIRAFVSVRETAHGSLVATFCRSGPHVRFPIQRIFARLNAEEPADLRGAWGGGDTIGGNHRVRRTTHTLASLTRCVNEEIAASATR